MLLHILGKYTSGNVMARSPSACPAGGTSPADRCCNLPSTVVAAAAVVCPAAAAAAARGSGPRVSLSAARQPDNKYFYTGQNIFMGSDNENISEFTIL